MSADRELLELAAKAAGHSLVWGDVYRVGGDTVDCSDIPYIEGDQPDELNAYWNPLEDDGDALRLAVKLRLCVEVVNGCTTIGNVVWVEDLDEGEVDGVIHGEDPYAATRRAIVLAAAEIGRQMP